ncbi:hypothetical protein LCGC14_0969470 [marine sediment metagenome]|uniref:Uncharacterized protein n=1 Tax=marine sediment metagenome TaxID=412755 RepID=A0A0F9NGI8_9ZZZZ
MEDEENNKKDKNINKRMLVGLDMVELIMRVREKFKKEYGFKPQIVEVTNVIAKRVNDNKLF